MATVVFKQAKDNTRRAGRVRVGQFIRTEGWRARGPLQNGKQLTGGDIFPP